jgi:hypothetical protein
MGIITSPSLQPTTFHTQFHSVGPFPHPHSRYLPPSTFHKLPISPPRPQLSTYLTSSSSSSDKHECNTLFLLSPAIVSLTGSDIVLFNRGIRSSG